MKRITVCALLLFTCVVSAKPERKAPPSAKQPTPKVVPVIAGESAWGSIAQIGRKVHVSGHPMWEADGVIRKDGKLYVVWTLLSDGRQAPGLYTIQDDGEIKGSWTWEAEEVETEGEFTRPSMVDVLRHKAKVDF